MQVGRYEVITHLATGGMAQIYLARQRGPRDFERYVVLKTLPERALDHPCVTMFLDEARLAATLHHQHIAQVYDVGQAGGAYFMAMEYVHGKDVRAILQATQRRGWRVPLELALMIAGSAAAGLHHAHERRDANGRPLNIVHRDVSPANIMVGYDGSVKVLDFGIAKAEQRLTNTLAGTIKGKYGYISPEQCLGRSIDRRSDIFGLGICLYELTTLRRAFKGSDDFHTLRRIVSGDVVPPSAVAPGYPHALEAIVLKALATDVRARFQTAQEMLDSLDTFAALARFTRSNTELGRFMVGLFGSRREPWTRSETDALTAIGSPPRKRALGSNQPPIRSEPDLPRQLPSSTAAAPGFRRTPQRRAESTAPTQVFRVSAALEALTTRAATAQERPALEASAPEAVSYAIDESVVCPDPGPSMLDAATDPRPASDRTERAPRRGARWPSWAVLVAVVVASLCVGGWFATVL